MNPIAVWEIKEYYHTTTFGSRVADGVYETLLDGMEPEELRQSENVDCRHYLMIDAHYTWWDCGRSYLCRIVDRLHMGDVDEVLVGSEVLSRLPQIAREWVEAHRARNTAASRGDGVSSPCSPGSPPAAERAGSGSTRSSTPPASAATARSGADVVARVRGRRGAAGPGRSGTPRTPVSSAAAERGTATRQSR